MNKLHEVFKLSGVPTFTFVKPQEYLRLKVAIDTPGRGLIIEGPSGIGKTTSVVKALLELNLPSEPVVLSARKSADIARIQSIPDENDFGLVIIDDFHRLDPETKSRYANLLKVMADEESQTSKLVLIGINKTGQPLLAVARDLRNRIDLIKFESNPEEKVHELLSLGETALNIKLSTSSEIASNAEGSFHIAQMLAHRACVMSEFVEQKTDLVEINASFETVRCSVLDDLALSFFDLAKTFCTGQRVKKGSRAPYLHVLNWLSKESDWSINIRDALSKHPDHKQSVGQIIDRGHLNDHLQKNKQLEEVVFYDDETSFLSIEDPKFFYYIKNIAWSNFARNIGFPSIEFKFTRDFALSFAGAQRDLAKQIFDNLSENEIAVFYDKNEQHRIAGESVEEYLAPIYSSESRFVVVLLSDDYPARLWCKFESDQFKKRFGDGAVIPVWLAGRPPSFFDLSSGIGGVGVDSTKPVNDQATEVCEVLINKIHAIRVEEESAVNTSALPDS